MGRAMVGGRPGAVVGLAVGWAETHGLRLSPNTGVGTSVDADLQQVCCSGRWGDARTRVRLELTAREAAGQTDVVVRALAPWAAAVARMVVGIGGMGLLLVSIQRADEMPVVLAVGGVLVGLLVGSSYNAWVKGTSQALVAAERSLWNAVAEKQLVLTTARTRGELLPGAWELAPLLCVGGLFVWATSLFGPLAGIVGAVLAGAGVYVGVLDVLLSSRTEWHWRFWIIESEQRWHLLCVSVTMVTGLLLVAENATVLVAEADYGVPDSIRAGFRIGRLREVEPQDAKALEADAKGYMAKWTAASYGAGDPGWEQPTGPVGFELNAALLLTVWGFLVTMTGGYVRKLLGLAQIWREEVGGRLASRGAHVPPGEGASRRVTKGSVALFLPHAMACGALNILGAALGLDALSYLCIGRALVFPCTAHAWSWIAAWSDNVLGDQWGALAAAVYLLMAGLPCLLVAIVSARRLVDWTRLAMRYVRCRATTAVLPGASSEKGLVLADRVAGVWKELGLVAPPAMIITDRGPPSVSLRPLLLGWWYVLEVGEEISEALTRAELRWIIAHELGHLRQGLWKLCALRVASSLLLFPNYYLTLCLDWAAMEMRADRFATETTGDAASCRSALTKLWAAQWARSEEERTGDSWLGALISNTVPAIRFFFGEGIAGYSYPLICERLAAARAFEESADE